ncbi:MAG: fructosamine kinase family protein [Thiobacillaceae bacterium]
MQCSQAIASAISKSTGQEFSIARSRPLGGGCINASRLIEGHGQRYFVKLNQAKRVDMFIAESAGLEEILHTAAIRVPTPIAYGESAGEAFLVLEYLEMSGRSSGARLGRNLAAMHRHTASQFGWKLDNTIGSTHQPNPWTDNWINFFRDYRLTHQLRLAAQNGYKGSLQRKGESLLANLHAFYCDYQPVPSLLHGDLWGGNAATLSSGEPVIFDPAVYYGDREADLAMTELFGGFSADFYAAYGEAWPLDEGYPVRKTLYNLYHILNHANLFGGGYAYQSESMIDRLLAEIA